jgi:hypothetical protein
MRQTSIFKPRYAGLHSSAVLAWKKHLPVKQQNPLQHSCSRAPILATVNNFMAVLARVCPAVYNNTRTHTNTPVEPHSSCLQYIPFTTEGVSSSPLVLRCATGRLWMAQLSCLPSCWYPAHTLWATHVAAVPSLSFNHHTAHMVPDVPFKTRAAHDVPYECQKFHTTQPYAAE